MLIRLVMVLFLGLNNLSFGMTTLLNSVKSVATHMYEKTKRVALDLTDKVKAQSFSWCPTYFWEKPFQKAIDENNLGDIKKLAEDAKCPLDQKEKALAYAVDLKKFAAARLLLKNKASYAKIFVRASFDGKPEVVLFFLQSGADPNITAEIDDEKLSPLPASMRAIGLMIGNTDLFDNGEKYNNFQNIMKNLAAYGSVTACDLRDNIMRLERINSWAPALGKALKEGQKMYKTVIQKRQDKLDTSLREILSEKFDDQFTPKDEQALVKDKAEPRKRITNKVVDIVLCYDACPTACYKDVTKALGDTEKPKV